MTNNDLDECHGHDHGQIGYHYHATIEYPYTVGCYKGNPILSSSGKNTNGACTGHGKTWGSGIGPPPAGCKIKPKKR